VSHTPLAIRPLTAADASSLAGFSCRLFKQPWTDLIEDMIQQGFADVLAKGSTSALGGWVGGTLCAVAAWSIGSKTERTVLCHSHIIAVQIGYRGHGYGRQIKEAECAAARAGGADAVESLVHWDNVAMLELNETVGARIWRVAGDRDYCRCIIPL